MGPLRAGLIGLGTMGRHHARVLSSLEGVELVGAVDPAAEATGGGVTGATLVSVAELISQRIDYCVVAAPTVVHEEIGLVLAEAGVPTLMEKPLAIDEPAASRLVEAFESRGIVAAVGHIERYNPALRELRRRLARGDIGRVVQVSTRRQGPFPSRISDVGVVKDLATHDIDLTAWVTGCAYTSVSAHTVYRSGRAHEDLVVAVGLLEDGAVASHLVNWISPFKERTTVVTGEAGAFVADTLSADLTLHSNGLVPTEWDEIAQFRGVAEGDVTRFAIAKPEPLRVEHESFRDAVLGLGSDIVSMRQGLATVRVANALLISASTGTAVSIPKTP